MSKSFMVPFSCIDVRIGVPIPFPAPESGASAGLGALPSAVECCGEVDAGEDAEVFGFAVVPVFEQPLGAILGSLDHLSAVLVGELPRLSWKGDAPNTRSGAVGMVFSFGGVPFVVILF